MSCFKKIDDNLYVSQDTPVWKLYDNETFVSAVMANHSGFDPHAQAKALLAQLQDKGFSCKYIPLKDNHQGLPCAEVRIFNTKGLAAFNAAFNAVKAFNNTWNTAPAAATPSPATRLSPTAEPYVPAQGGAAAAAATPTPPREIPGLPPAMTKTQKKKAAQAVAAASAASATTTPSSQTGAAAAADDGFTQAKTSTQLKKEKKAAAAAARTTGPSYSGVAKQGVATTITPVPTGGAAAVPTTAPVPPTETDYQRLERLKKEQDAINKRQLEIQEAIKQAEKAVKEHDANSLASMIAFAASRGDEFMQLLLKDLQSKMRQPTVSSDGAATATTPVQAAAAAATPEPTAAVDAPLPQRKKKSKENTNIDESGAAAATPVQAAAAAETTATDGSAAEATATAPEKKEEKCSAWGEEPASN